MLVFSSSTIYVSVYNGGLAYKFYQCNQRGFAPNHVFKSKQIELKRDTSIISRQHCHTDLLIGRSLKILNEQERSANMTINLKRGYPL